MNIARSMTLALLALSTLVLAPALWAHCQIPCGIYGDEGRFDTLREHVTTIEKSMNEIKAQDAAEKKTWNQLVRWVNNKEEHADQLSEIVTYYFLAQRIKPAAESDAAAFAKYQKEVTLLHKMLVHAMKAKQTTDQEHVDALRKLIDEFAKSYHGHK